MLKQRTLKGSFSLCGKGLHTGLSLTVTFCPAPENTGYKIQRIDLEGEPIIVLLVYEAPTCKCAERPCLQRWFKDNNYILNELHINK